MLDINYEKDATPRSEASGEARGQETLKKKSHKGDSLKTKRRVDHANILVLSRAVEIT